MNRCNCPLDQDEQQWQIVGNLTKIWGNHSIKFGADVRRAYNLRVPSDRHRSGELTFNSDRTSLNGQGGMGLATFMLGDVTTFSRYVSPNTERARAAVAPLLLRAGHVARRRRSSR